MQSKEKNASGGVLNRLFSMTELCKALLFFACGYLFCFLFLLDYSIPDITVFHRDSTTSLSGLQHPVLYLIYLMLLGFSQFLNLGYMRRRYQCHNKLVAVCHYAGFCALIIVALIKADHPQIWWIHTLFSVVYAAMNGFTILLLVAFEKKRYPRFRSFFYGGIVFTVAVATGFLIQLCGFMETVPMLIAMTTLYVINFTNVVPPVRNSEAA